MTGIMTDSELIEWASYGGIIPFNSNNINPASVDLTLSSEWRDAEYPARLFYSEHINLHPPSLTVYLKNLFGKKLWYTYVLACTVEYITLPDDMAASIRLKTTPTREGLAHPIADWIDPGFNGQLTLMLHANMPITVYCGDPIVQMVVYKLSKSVDKSYKETGHYYDQKGPTPSWKRSQIPRND